MSSFVRRLEIRILRKKKYVRQTQKVIMSKLTGRPEIIPIKHGNIIRPDGTDTGSPFWPRPRAC